MIWDAASLRLQEADPAAATWGQSLRRGVEAFFTVERVRDIVIILIAAGLYYWLARHAKDRMILTPTRVVVAQDLQSVVRAGVSHADLTETIELLESATKSPQGQEKAILTGLALRRDLAAETMEKRLAGLSGPALIAASRGVEGSLGAPVQGYLSKATLTAPEMEDLRKSVARISRDQADKTWSETRLALRRLRKSQSLGVAGLLLIVLLVIFFGNPALIAFGVLGAVVSRTIAFFRDSTDTDQKYNWVVLFLVPVVGGLSAYGGVLLIDAMRTWGLLGDAFTGVDFGGEHANAPTMAAAFLFGFVERLLDNVASTGADGLGAVTAKEQQKADPPDTGSPNSPTAESQTVGGSPTGTQDGGATPPPQQSSPHQPPPQQPPPEKPEPPQQPPTQAPPAPKTGVSLGAFIESFLEEIATRADAWLTPARDANEPDVAGADPLSSNRRPSATTPHPEAPATSAAAGDDAVSSASDQPIELTESLTPGAAHTSHSEGDGVSEHPQPPEGERGSQSH